MQHFRTTSTCLVHLKCKGEMHWHGFFPGFPRLAVPECFIFKTLAPWNTYKCASVSASNNSVLFIGLILITKWWSCLHQYIPTERLHDQHDAHMTLCMMPGVLFVCWTHHLKSTKFSRRLNDLLFECNFHDGDKNAFVYTARVYSILSPAPHFKKKCNNFNYGCDLKECDVVFFLLSATRHDTILAELRFNF